jgi:alpha-L-fucosidase
MMVAALCAVFLEESLPSAHAAEKAVPAAETSAGSTKEPEPKEDRTVGKASATQRPDVLQLEDVKTDWKELVKVWQCPDWIQDAKFGLWIHWGPASVPRLGGGWYAKHMYMPQHKELWGRNAYSHHCATYGHPSEFGFKDLCHLWTAEKYDPDKLVRQFKDWGARYVAVLVNHHDNFDLYPTSIHKWNSVNIGPKRDLVGEFAAAARAHGLPWVATVHATRPFYPKPGAADKTGPKAGVPYDLAMTQEDGRGKWWEGLNPRDLYCLSPKEIISQRTLDLVDRYRPDMLYFDNSKVPVDERVVAHYYQESLRRHGSIQAIVTTKAGGAGLMLDMERGQANKLLNKVWQTDTTMFNGWFRKEDEGDQNLRYDTRCLIEMLVDIVSKNGVLLLNVALYGDGSIPQDQAVEIQGLADWLKIHGEAIYATRPWKIHGVGGATASGHFSERTRAGTAHGPASEAWDNNVIRFTRSKDGKTLYFFVFGDAAGKHIVVKPLAPDQGLFDGQVRKAYLLATKTSLDATVASDGLRLPMPQTLPSKVCNVIALETNGLF